MCIKENETKVLSVDELSYSLPDARFMDFDRATFVFRNFLPVSSVAVEVSRDVYHWTILLQPNVVFTVAELNIKLKSLNQHVVTISLQSTRNTAFQQRVVLRKNITNERWIDIKSANEYEIVTNQGLITLNDFQDHHLPKKIYHNKLDVTNKLFGTSRLCRSKVLSFLKFIKHAEKSTPTNKIKHDNCEKENQKKLKHINFIPSSDTSNTHITSKSVNSDSDKIEYTPRQFNNKILSSFFSEIKAIDEKMEVELDVWAPKPSLYMLRSDRRVIMQHLSTIRNYLLLCGNLSRACHRYPNRIPDDAPNIYIVGDVKAKWRSELVQAGLPICSIALEEKYTEFMFHECGWTQSETREDLLEAKFIF